MLNHLKKTNLGSANQLSTFESGKLIAEKEYYKQFNRLSLGFLGVVAIIMFIPWTQNITGMGSVTTLKPNHRPQTVQSPIPGRIEEWFVQEGDYVTQGDTILRISEIKSEFFDEKLLDRTRNQIESKSATLVAYENKIKALENQVSALTTEQGLSIRQAKNRLKQCQFLIQSDSIDYAAAKINQVIAQTQFDRVVSLKKDGLKATKDVEEKRTKLQLAIAKSISQKNKLSESRNKALNAQIEMARISADFNDRIASAQSNLFTAKSNQLNGQVELSRMENSYSNFHKRTTLRYITAPQNGYINKTIKGGIGLTFQAGESLIKIMPANYELAVETYVRPIDLPLMHIGERVRVQFDGWPAIVFSGWESVSYGTYGARVVAIENYISDNGMYRILLIPDKQDHEWPDGIRVGSGAKTIALLNDVPIWYELWRQLNGFPPEFYKPANQ